MKSTKIQLKNDQKSIFFSKFIKSTKIKFNQIKSKLIQLKFNYKLQK